MFEFPLSSYPPLVGIVALLLFPYLQMGRTKLVPWSLVEMERQNAERWRRAHEVSEAARQVQSEQMRELLAQSETSVALLRSITEHKP